ncbi:hypothetical protein IAT40_002457 [Kwoniella sp. CBS 6097]
MTIQPLKLDDFTLTDLTTPTGLKPQYCFDRRLRLTLHRGWLPMTFENYKLWDQQGDLLLKCVDYLAIFEDYKLIMNGDGEVVYTLHAPDRGIADDIYEGQAPGIGKGPALGSCVDAAGPKRDIAVGFADFQSKTKAQWRLIFINGNNDAVLLQGENAIAKISKGKWWLSACHIELGKNVDYSLVMMAIIASDVVGLSGDLRNPTMEQVFTNTIDLMRDMGYEKYLGKRQAQSNIL